VLELNSQIFTVFGIGVLVGSSIMYAIYKLTSTGSLPKDKEGYLVSIVHSVCLVAETLYLGSGRGKEKLAFVLGVMLHECERLGLSYDVDKLTEIVDAYIKDVLNAGKNLPTPVTPAQPVTK